MIRIAAASALGLMVAATLAAQQVADSAFRPELGPPAFAERGPVVAIDEGHHNFHTVDGRYRPFAAVLRHDGYVVQGHAGAITAASLRGVDVLVIANPLHASNVGHWTLPTPSAFSDAEIAVLRAWVERGGALLLIADHMPFGGAAERLGAAFGLRWTNGFATDVDRTGPVTTAYATPPLVFSRTAGNLADHPITRGRSRGERVDSVVTFTGSAFRAPAGAALMTFGPAAASQNPRTAWQFDSSTTAIVPVDGWQQGAAFRVGRGRVAAFGEAAMFSAQLTGARRFPIGMNSPRAAQNPRFLLNTLHWLSGLLDGDAR